MIRFLDWTTLYFRSYRNYYRAFQAELNIKTVHSKHPVIIAALFDFFCFLFICSSSLKPYFFFLLLFLKSATFCTFWKKKLSHDLLLRKIGACDEKKNRKKSIVPQFCWLNRSRSHQQKDFFCFLEKAMERLECIRKKKEQDTRTWIIPTALFTVVHKGKLHPESLYLKVLPPLAIIPVLVRWSNTMLVLF